MTHTCRPNRGLPMIRRALLACAIAAAPGPTQASAQRAIEPHGPGRSVGAVSEAHRVEILLDVSESMSLPMDLNKDDRASPSRLDEAEHFLREVVSGGNGNIAWSLATFAGPGTFDVVSGFAAGAVPPALQGPPTGGGLTALDEGLAFAEDQIDTDPGDSDDLLVITDGVGTGPGMARTLNVARFWDGKPRLIVGLIPLERAPEEERRVHAWIASLGGIAFDITAAGSAAATLSAIESGATGAAASAAPVSAVAPVSEPRPGGSSNGAAPSNPPVPSKPPAVLGALAAYALSPFLALLAILILPIRRNFWKRATERARAQRRREVAMIVRNESSSQGEPLTVRDFPWTLAIPRRAGFTGATLEFVPAGDRIVVQSSSPFLMGGVEARRSAFRGSARLRTQGYIFALSGPIVRTFGPADPRPPQARRHFVAAGLLLLAGIVGAVIVLPRLPAGAGGTAPAVSREHDAAAPEIASFPKPPAESAFSNAAINAIAPFTQTETVAPGAPPRYFPADIMFIHTHPDDESIDFGALIARAARAGKKVVVVLFTDGGSGLDSFPNRSVGGRYPDHAMHGAELAKVRSEEAQSALSILGAQAYVRLGLYNSPYNGLRDILPLDEVLHRWGGERAVVAKLVALIEGYRPRIVVSTDAHHAGVFQHFEHEAVGYVTNRALADVRARGESFVRAHIVNVNPELVDAYPGAFGVDVNQVDPGTGVSDRDIQRAALAEHRTQHDASVIAAEVLPNFDEEYYAVDFWDLPIPPDDYFAELVPVPGVPTPDAGR